jgi:hypothetical protein
MVTEHLSRLQRFVLAWLAHDQGNLSTRLHNHEAKGLVTIARTPGGKAKAVELIPAGCQEVVNKEHLTDPDPAHRGMGVYSVAKATDITKAPREKRSDGNCSGVTSEAARITIRMG